MHNPPHEVRGARDSSDADASLAGDAPVSSNFRVPVKSSVPVQAIPECEAEALAWGYGLPPADHLTEVRAMWLRLRRLGVALPAERRVILITGGYHGS